MSWIHWRHAARALWRRPLFALSSTLVLALGIAAAVVVFTLVDAMLLRPPPVHEPERLLAIGTQPPPDAQWTSQTVAMPVVAEWRRAARTFDEIGGYVARQLAWSGPDGVERLEAGATVGDLFGVLGLRMALGRALTEGETGAAVLSHEFWQRRFGGRPSVLGETIVLDGISCAIVGVLPPETAMPLLAANVERLVWIASPGGAAGDRELVYVAGRLGPEASPEAAEAELEALQHAVEEQLAVENQALGVVLQTLQQQRFAIAGRALTSLFGGALVLLLIACANVGMLSLAQAAGRRHEMAVRSSLGAPRARLLGQAAAEHALLWCVGGVLGIAFAIAGLRAAAATNPFPILGSDAFLIDARVLLFALAATLVTAVLFGIAPALKLASVDAAQVIREGAGTSSAAGRASRVQRLLVGGQVTLSTVLAAGACLLAVSFFNLISQPLGFAPEGLLTFRVQLGQREYPDLASKATLHRDLREALRALPGVEAAGTTSARPLGTIVVGPIEIRGGDYGGEQPWAGIQAVDPSYFGAARIPLAAGRPFDARDAAGEPAVIINERLARSYFAAEEPLGRLVKLGPAESEAPWLRVVGVVGDVKHAGLAWEYLPEIFVPYGSLEGPVDALLHNDIFVTLRAAQRPAEATLRRTVAALDPDLPITEILTGEDIVALSAQSARFQANVMTAVALLAVILAGVGLYGVVAQSVAQRRKELAIRMALGASAPRVFWTACRQASALAASGTVCGVAVTYALARSVQALLFQVDADDPRILLGVASVMLLLAAAAMVPPGLRAATAQPAAVVRGE